MQAVPLTKLYAEFGSVLEDGEVGLQNATPDTRSYAHALTGDFASLRNTMNGFINPSHVSRIELVHQPEPGVIGLVVYMPTRPMVPVLYLRSAHYYAPCDGSRLADELFTLVMIPREVWGGFAQDLHGKYYSVVITREALAMTDGGQPATLPDSICGKWWMESRTTPIR